VEDRTIRHRQADIADRLDRLPIEDDPGGLVLVVKTVADPLGGTYPTAALRVYPVEIQQVGGTEAANQAVTFTATGKVRYAANIGSAVPPVNTNGILATLFGGRLVIEYR
jgi:hypothetical protein